jgi:hypothetical protein
MAEFLGLGDCYVVYTDDGSIWCYGKTWREVKTALEDKAAKFAVWAKWNELAMNASKTQLLVSSKAGPAGGLSVRVGENEIACSATLELLGVAFDRKMSTAPDMDNMAKFARQRAVLIARLTNHVPKGLFLRQLACGLVHGKVGHA